MSGNSTGIQKQLSVLLGEDAYNGDAYAIITVDGVAAFQGAITASEQGNGQLVALGSYDASTSHTISVQFTNDLYGGSPSSDRNLYVKDVLVNGASTAQSDALYSNGTVNFAVPASTATVSPTTVVGAGPDTIQFSLTEDAWQGDAQYVVLVDGQQVGGVQTLTALHGSGQEQLLDVEGSFTAAAHTVGVQFLNDAWGGSPDTDRNLYVDAVSVNGVDQHLSHAQDTNGAATFSLQAVAAPVSTTSTVSTSTTTAAGGVVTNSTTQTIQVVASEDAYQGDAVLVISVDGVAVSDPLLVTASHAAGATQSFSVSGNFGPGSHTVSAAFVDDDYGGSPGADRNLYIQSVSLNGVALPGAAGPLFGNAAVTGTFTSTAPAAAPVTVSAAPVAPTVPAPVATPPATIGADNTVGLIPIGTPVYAAGSPVETVGVGKEFSSIGAAVAAATDGTVILVDAGTYTNDFATNYAKVTLIAVGGRVEDVATVPPPNYKGLITTENDLTVEGFDFSGVRIPDEEGHNGAGIRDDNGNLVLENDSFSQNQDGILTNSGNYSITIDHSVFNDNGGNDGNGAGNIHNVYIGSIASVTATNSIFENAQVGHEFKSRAAANTLTNNEFIDGVGIGTGSYDIDLPDGGKDTVTGNTIIKGANAENHALVHFGGEGIPYAGSSLTLTGNLFEADNNPSALAVLNQTAITVNITGNVFQNIGASAIAQGPASISNNFDASGTAIQNQQLVGVLPGSTYTATDALPHSVVFYGGTVQAAQGGAGLLTVTAQVGHIIVIGGTGGINVTETPYTGGNQYTTAAGSTNTLNLVQGIAGDSIDSEGTDTILSGNSNQSGQLNGNATVTDGTGTYLWSVGGTAAIQTNNGSDFINLAATATVSITGTNGFFALSSNGGNASWNTVNSGVHLAGSASTGAFSFQAYNGALLLSTTSGAAGTVLHLDSGDAQVTSLGADTIYAGSGNDTVILSGAAKVYAGTGKLAIYGHVDQAGADVYGAGGDYLISGDTGGITYHGGALASTVEAQLNNITLVGGAGQLTVNGGSRDTVTGGSGGLVLNDFNNGANTISTAAGSTNVLNLSGGDQVTSRGNDTITLDAGNSSFAVYGTANLLLEAGNSYADLYGNDTITTLSGSDHFTAEAGSTVAVTSSNLDFINSQGATLAVTFTDGGSGGAVSTVSVSGPGNAAVSTNPGSGIDVATTGTAPVSITTNDQISVEAAGNTAIHLGAGAATLALTGNGNEVWAGSGSLSVRDSGNAGGNFVLHGGSGNVALGLDQNHVTFIGGSGAATLSGGVLDIVGGAGSISVAGNYGQNVRSFVGGTGTASLALNDKGADITFGAGQTSVQELGWGATDTFHFVAGASGTDTVANFRIGTDHAVLGAGVSVTAASLAGGAAQFALSNGAHVSFAGVSTTQGIFG